MVRLINLSVSNGNQEYRDSDVKVMAYLFIQQIIDYAFSTSIPRQPRYIMAPKLFKNDLSKYAYGQYTTMNDVDYYDLLGKSTNHVFVTLYQRCIHNNDDKNHSIKRLFVEAFKKENCYLLIYMIARNLGRL